MNVVFDFGGVLFDWQPHRVLQAVLPRHATDEASGRAWAARFFEGYGGDWAAFDRGETGEAALAERIARRTGLEPHEAAAVIAAVPRALKPVPAMVDLLERLHAGGAPVYFLSNMPASYADHLERTHAFVRRFRDGVFSSRVRRVKPEPAIFELASRRFGIDDAATVFIDDVRENVEAARRHGWQAIHYRDPADCEAALAELRGVPAR